MEPIPLSAQYVLTLTALTVGGSENNSATVAYTLQDAAGTSKGTGTLTAAGTGGNYSATVTAATTGTLTPGETYTFVVTVTVSGTLVDTRYATARAYRRGVV